MEAIVLAGGFGTRLTHVVSDVPKPMAPVGGKPFLEYVLADVARKGIHRIVLAVGYKRECIMAHFGDTFQGMEILYSQEETPLYTGGAIRRALTLCREPTVFVINGDTFFDVPLQAMAAEHAQKGAALSIAVKKMRPIERYGTVRFSPEGQITGFQEKQPLPQGYINGGIYRINAKLLTPYPEAFSFEKQVLEKDFARHRMHAFIAGGYFIDIGIPEDYYRAQREMQDYE